MKRMISTKAAETAEGIKDFVKQNGKTTEFGGNVEIDGNLKVNGSAPGGALNVYLCTSVTDPETYGNGISFIIVTEKTITSIDDVKNYFNDNNITKGYPCSGFYKYGGGGGDSAPIGLIYWNVPNLTFGYYNAGTYTTETLSSVTITKLN